MLIEQLPKKTYLNIFGVNKILAKHKFLIPKLYEKFNICKTMKFS